MQEPSRPPEPLQPKLVRELWGGPLGSVWLAQISDGPGVAQAGLVRRVVGLEERLTRVQQAAEVAKLLSHRSLLKVLGSDRSTDGSLSVISQNLECISLRALARGAIERGNLLPAPVAVRIVADALQAACALHKQLATIRFDRSGYDLSLFADTIIVSQAGETLLMDPVVSGQLAALLLARGERELVVYRAPEELGNAAPSERGEVWTAGLLLWELLAGRRVCDSSHSDEALAALRAGRVPPLEQGRPAMSPSLGRLIERAMSPRPERRPGTLAEFARALQAFGPNVVASSEAVREAITPYLDHEHQIAVESDEISDVVDPPTGSQQMGAPPSSQDWEPPTLIRDISSVSVLPTPAAVEPLPRSPVTAAGRVSVLPLPPLPRSPVTAAGRVSVLPPPPLPRSPVTAAGRVSALPLPPLPRFPDTVAGSVAALPPRSTIKHTPALLIGLGALTLALTLWLVLRNGTAESATASPPPAAVATSAEAPPAAATPAAEDERAPSEEPVEEPVEEPQATPAPSRKKPAQAPAQGPESFHPKGI